MSDEAKKSFVSLSHSIWCLNKTTYQGITLSLIQRCPLTTTGVCHQHFSKYYNDRHYSNHTTHTPKFTANSKPFTPLHTEITMTCIIHIKYILVPPSGTLALAVGRSSRAQAAGLSEVNT